MNWGCPPCSQEAVEGGDRLFLSSPAAGQNVDTHTRTNLVTEYMDSGYVTCIPRVHHRGESELLFPHPRPESNSKGRLWKEDGPSDKASLSGSPVLSHFIHTFKKVHILSCVGQMTAH